MARWFVSVSLCLVLMTQAFWIEPVHAESGDSKTLSDGVILLQTLDNTNPQRNRLLKEIDKRLPESAKKNTGDSPLFIKATDENRKFAADNNDDFTFIRKSDGTVGVANRSRVSASVTATAQHLIDHEDFPTLFTENYDRLKAEHEKVLAKVKKRGGLAGAAASLASNVATFPTRTASPSELRTYANRVWGFVYPKVMEEIDRSSNAIKKEELARIARGDPRPEPKPAETAEEPEEAEDESKTAEAEKPADAGAEETAASRARAIQKLDGLFNDVDRQVAQFEARAQQDLALCQRATDALANGSEIDRLADEAKRRLAPAKVTSGTEKINDGPVVEQLNNILNTLKSTNRLAKDAGTNACEVSEDVTAASLRQDADKAGNLAVLADQLHDAAKSLAKPLMVHLSKYEISSTPLMSLADEFDAKRRAAYKPLEDYCTAFQSQLKPLADKIRYADSLSTHWSKDATNDGVKSALIKANLGASGQTSLESGPSADFLSLDAVTKLTYKARLASYRSRMAATVEKGGKCTHHHLLLASAKCIGAFNLTESGFRDTEEYARAHDAQVTIRRAQLANVRALLGEIERAAKQARAASQRARACVQQAEADGKVANPQAVADVAGLADLSAVFCDVAEFDRRIGELRATKYKDVDGIAQHISNLENKRNTVQAAHAKFNEGRTHFIDGDPAAASAQLQAARTELAKLNGAPQCPELAGRIDKGEQQSQQLGDILSSSNAAFGTCKIADIRAALKKIGGKTKPAKLLELKNRLEQQWGVLTIVGEARAAYRAGKFEQSLSLLRKAKAAKRGVAGDCPVIDQRIDNATAAVERKREENDGSARVAEAARTCNMVVLRSFVPGYGGITKALKAQADDALQVCRAKDEDRRARNKADQLAARKAKCRTDHGAGYYPGKPRADGTYYCIPTRETANRWCRENNPGAGSRAVNIKKDGSHSCRANRKTQKANARADCRRQIRNKGKVYAFTRINRDGTYNCFSCEPGFRWRKGRCRQRGGTQRRTGGGGRFRPGKYKCTIFNPDGSLLGGGGSTRTIITNRPMRGHGIRCRRIR
ncbi:MAG: hypothetical protein GY948_22125 [Alphaproteobacteria bacterium]|nr:hypothetical protein [Alphaproteobacteria bacterium]